ncbi:uncharacterized protein [Epargyreus clarus]|uniref:uncharacterized protein isoform X2 n=1 Tax=Epargyreus clarus TaxID=520877 RepID=UPI003C2B058B
MKWVVVAGFLLCFANNIRAGVRGRDLPFGKECLPGSQWISQCNSCTCNADGRPACTDRICPGHENEPMRQCAPSTRWQIECFNTCSCGPEGTASCTELGCADENPYPNDREGIEKESSVPAIRSAPSEKAVVCAANRMFIKDCNTCWCNEDGTSYFCTRKVCVPELPDETTTEEPEELGVIKRQCRPDEVFEMDCNMCRCNPDGKSFSCTRRACIPEDDGKNSSLIRKARATSQETPKTCQPGQEFRMDCNKCLCDNEGQDYSCTRIDCASLHNNNNGGVRRKREVATQAIECTPGSVFEQGCKVCRCAQDGRHAICPTHCQNEKKLSENDISNTDSDPSFRCNPGEQFKRSCNDCTCSADGRSFFCTLRLCEQEITPNI